MRDAAKMVVQFALPQRYIHTQLAGISSVPSRLVPDPVPHSHLTSPHLTSASRSHCPLLSLPLVLVPPPKSVASLAALGRPQLVHLLDALLELLVLALFVRVSLVLRTGGWVSECVPGNWSDTIYICVCLRLCVSVCSVMTEGWAGLPRTSTAGSTPRSDTGSMGSADVRTSPGRRGAAWRRSFPRAWPLWAVSVRVRAGAAKSKGKGRAGRTPVAEADGALDCFGDGHGGGLVVGVDVGGVAGCGQDASRWSWALLTR
jgi:hypothetical protein